MDSATIVSAALDSKQLEDSINKLVATVASKTKEMADNFTSEVARMEQAVKNLGNIKIDSGGTSDGGSSRRTSKQKEEESQVKATTQAYKEQAMTFDQQSALIKKASRGSSAGLKKELDEASNSYANLIQQLQRTISHFDVSPIQSLRMRQHELEAGMRTASNEAAKAKKDVDELNAAIANYRATLETLPKNGQGFSNRQAIQKEINDLITLRDVSSAEQQKWEAASRQLASQYEVVKNEIKQIGQALIAAEESEKHVTTELDKQLQKINEISSRKTATQTYRDAISMETDSLEKAESKLAVLQALKTKILNTDLLSKKDTESLTSYISYTTALVERMRSKTAKSTKDDEEAIRKAAEAEKKWADNIVARGQIAQETSRKLIRMLNEEAQAGGKGLMGMYKIDGKDVSAVKELEKAIKDMQMQYNQMSDMDKDSAIGRALKRDIENAKIASGVISGYNKAASGVFNRTSDSESFKIRNYETLKNVLKELTNQYNQVSIAEIKAGNANHIIDAIQRTSREAQQLQSIMNRPTSFASAMKLSEKTLDDLSYKIRQLQSYKLGIDLQNPNAANEIKQVDEALVRLQKDMDKYLSKSRDVLNSNNALGRSWNYMKNRLAFYFSVGASTQFIKNLIEVRSQYEMNERALGILINSAERGTQIFNELSQMALVSPYTLIELSAAAKQLTAYDVAARDVVDTTRRLADMAAAVGIPIERLTYALGQIKAYGYLNSRDARMFANAGIPLVKQLSEYYTELEGRLVSTADVYDRIKKKSIDYNEVMEVMYKMTDQGGKFFDFQAKMADTLKVRLANLTLAWNNMLNDMGKDTQGVLTWGIGALRDMFNQWRVLDRAIKDVAWVVGIRTGIALASYSLQKFIALLRGTQSQMALSEVFGKRLANVIRTLVRSMLALAKNPLTWVGVVAIGLYQMEQAIWGANEAQIALNKSIRDGAKDNYDNITKFLEQYKRVRESLYTTQKVAIGNMYNPATGKASATAYVEQSVEQDIDKNEAKKAWEAIREQIELTTRSSDQYIGRLLEISNMSERVRQGFNMLEDIRVVNAALKELDEDTIKVEKDMSAWWNAYQMPDGLIGNIKDYQKALDDVIEKFGSLEGLLSDVHVGGDNWGDFNDYQTALERLQASVKTTTDSIINFIELKGWSGDINKINEVFKQVADKIALDNQLDPQKAFVLQTQVEEARSQAAKQALLQRINDEKAALAQTSEENQRKAIIDSINANVTEYNNWNDYNGRKKAEWERFTKWLKEQHISETTAMFRNMDAEDIKSLNFQEGKYGEYVTRMVEMYAKEHKMSYDEAFNYLKGWVTNANKWSVFIPLVISTEDKKSVYDQLGEYDKAIDAADSEIERLTTRIDELRKKKKLDKDETDELTRAEQELADARKAKADAEAKGGHGKKEKKDERAAQKAQKQAESELQKALKEELSIIDKIRSNYQALTKEGMSHADAIKASTSGYEKSAKSINQTLAKFGLQAFDPSAFAGISDPNDLVKLLEDQLNKLIRSGKAKPAEIKDLEVKINDVKLDAEKYNLTRITKGLNNELDKLKDEYELSVELDANPELGDMFADMFGIDTSTLPQTFGEALDRAQEIINRKLSNLNIASPFDLMQSDVNEFANSSGLEKESGAIKELAKWQNTFRDMFKKNLLDSEKMLDDYVKKYGGYSDKIAEIEADRLEKIKKLNDAYYTEEMRQRPEYIAKMNAINQGASREKSNVEFDSFKNSRYYTMMFENLDYISTKTIRDMRDRLRELMDSMKDLTPEQLKQVMTQYEKLEQKLVKRSPFKTLTKDLKNYLKTSGDRKAANEAFRNAQKEYDAQEKNVAALKEKYEQAKANTNTSKSYLDFLQIEINAQSDILDIFKKQLELAEKKADKYNLTAKLAKSEALQVAQVVAANLNGLAELRDQMNELFGIDASKGETLLGHEIDGLIDGLSKAGDGISKITSSAQSGNVFGVVSGAVDVFTGIGDSIASLFGDGSARTKRLNREINESKESVRQLSMAYDDLERAVSKSLGTAETEARRAAIANKELQLSELERQKMLEESKRSKDRDDDAIKQYEEAIHSLRNEISDLKEDVVNNLFGEDVKSAAEAFVDAWVQAWREGETTLDAIEEKMDEMIYNLIKKAMTSKIAETLLNPIYKELDRMTKEGSEGGVALTTNELRQLAQQAGITAGEINTALGEFYGNLEQLGIVSKTEDKSSELSALQQGLQSMSESTANALEAYANSISQQAYLRNDLLVQIRDTIMSFDMDVQLGVFSQMLLQLQNNYIVMQSMQSMMEGWTTPSGQGIRVELIS